MFLINFKKLLIKHLIVVSTPIINMTNALVLLRAQLNVFNEQQLMVPITYCSLHSKKHSKSPTTLIEVFL